MWCPFDFFFSPAPQTSCVHHWATDWLVHTHQTDIWLSVIVYLHFILMNHLPNCWKILTKKKKRLSSVLKIIWKKQYVSLAYSICKRFCRVRSKCWGWNLKCSLECWNSLKLSLNRTTRNYTEPFNSKIITPALISLLFIAIHKTYKNGRTNTEYIKLLSSSVKHQSSWDK